MLTINLDTPSPFEKLLSTCRVLIFTLVAVLVLATGILQLKIILLVGYVVCQLMLWRITGYTTWRNSIALLLDIGLLSHVIYLFDGVLSGWVSLLLLPALIGALSLPLMFAVAVSFCAIASYFTLLQLYLVRVGELGEHAHHVHTSMSEHLFGMLATFVVCVALLTGFISWQMRTIRIQQRHLTQLHDRQWRQRQIVSMATYNANTAHKLATPLATSKLLLDEALEELAVGEHSIRKLLESMRQQLHCCEQQLDKMRQHAKQADAAESATVHISSWLRRVLHDWWNAHNEILLSIDIDPELNNKQVLSNPSLEYALSNILDNSARAAFQSADLRIQVHAHIDQQNVKITLTDFGLGIQYSDQQRLGKQAVESDDGMGIGLLLTQETIEEYAGNMHITSSESGTTVTVLLPLTHD